MDIQSIYFGQRHKDFSHEDFEIVKKVSRLAKKHHKQCENSCNGYGVVKGQMYYGGQIDDYAKREYGQGVKSAYLTAECEESVFDKETTRLEGLIVASLHNNKFRVEFQGDPRGATVKLFYENDYIEL